MRTFKLAALLLLAATPLSATAAPVANVAAAVASSGRSADNVKLDESRKPAAVLEYLGLRRGMSAIDLFGGNRYWAEIMAPAVGPKGHVLVWEPASLPTTRRRRPSPNSRRRTATLHGVDAVRGDLSAEKLR